MAPTSVETLVTLRDQLQRAHAARFAPEIVAVWSGELAGVPSFRSR